MGGEQCDWLVAVFVVISSITTFTQVVLLQTWTLLEWSPASYRADSASIFKLDGQVKGRDHNKYVEEDSDDESDEEEIDIHEVARTGSLEEMEWALMKDRLYWCSLKDERSRIALHYACELGRTEIAVSSLLQKGSDPNFRDVKEMSSLLFACANGHTDLARL